MPQDRLNIVASESNLRDCKSTGGKRRSPRTKEQESKKRCTNVPVNGDEFFLPAVVRRERRCDPKHWGHKEWLLAEPPKVWEPVDGSTPSAGFGESNLWTVKCNREQAQRRKRREQDDQAEASELWSVAPFTDGNAAICDVAPEVGAETGHAVVAAKDGQNVSVTEGGSDGEPLGPDDEPKSYELFDEEETAAKRDLWNEINTELLEYWELGRRRRLREQATAQKRKELAKVRERHRLEEARRRSEMLAQQQQPRQRSHRNKIVRPRRADGSPAGSTEDAIAAADDLDSSVFGFWQTHDANSKKLFPGVAVSSAPDQQSAGVACFPSTVSFAADEELHQVEYDSVESRAKAREALEVALQEEHEAKQKLKQRQRVARAVCDLFS